MHGAWRQVGRSGAQGIGDGGHRQPELSHPPAVDRHTDFRRGDCPGTAAAHPGNAVHPLAQILGKLFEPAITGGVADQRKLEDGGFGGAAFLEFEALQRRWQRRADGVDLAHHLVIVFFGIAGPTEFGGDDGTRIGRSRLDADDAIEPLKHILDRAGDGGFHVRRLGTRHDGNDADERRGEMRIDRPRDGEECRQADGEQQRKRDQRDLPASDGEIDEAHRVNRARRQISPQLARHRAGGRARK